MFKRLLIKVLALSLVVAFSVQSATASDPNWREKQEARFEQTGLTPGDIITKENWNKVDGLIPPEMLEWVKKSYIEMKIGELKHDVTADDVWMKKSAENVGKYKLNDKNNLVETATGEPPLWVDGIPFPDIDTKNDPGAATKYAYNRTVSLHRMGSFKEEVSLTWIGRGGFERRLETTLYQYAFWARPGGPIENPAGHRYRDIVAASEPYHLAGINQLTFRKLDASDDEVYVYVPAIRRVKKMSGANRSDPYMGCDACVDDLDGFGGTTTSMKWKFVEEKLGLLCLTEWDSKNINNMKQRADGTWLAQPGIPGKMTVGFEVKNEKVAKWAPVDVVWTPRIFYVLEVMPVDPYYNAGKTLFWIDRDTYWINFKITCNRAGEYWKTVIYVPRCYEWAGMKGVQTGGVGYLIVDEKTNHATLVDASFAGGVSKTEFGNPRINPNMFTVENLRMVSK